MRFLSYSDTIATRVCFGNWHSWVAEMKGHHKKRHQTRNVPTAANLKAGQDVKHSSPRPRAMYVGDTRSVLNRSVEALWDVTGEGAKVARYLRSVPKIKWNKSALAHAKQHVPSYKHTYSTFPHCIFFLTVSIVKNDLMTLLYYEVYYKNWKQRSG